MANPNVPAVIAISGSAGAVAGLQKLAAALPSNLQAAVVVALHVWPGGRSVLPDLLNSAGPNPAMHVLNQRPVEPGRIYVAPPDRHLLLQNGSVRAFYGPAENRHRPSIDVLFRSVAIAHGERAIGVLLSGADDDGAAGLHILKRSGGIAVVQDPDDALFAEMPLSALRNFEPDYKLPLTEIGPTLARLVSEKLEKGGQVGAEQRKATDDPGEQIPEASEEQFGTPSAFTCPDCGGSLWELEEGELMRFRCRVGHAYSPAAMLEAESDMVERALWGAIRVLKESAAVCRRIASKTSALDQTFTKPASERQHYAEVIRDLLESGDFKS